MLYRFAILRVIANIIIAQQPNIIYIMSDDHVTDAINTYDK